MSLHQQETVGTLHDPHSPGTKLENNRHDGTGAFGHRARGYDAQPFLPRYDRRWANPSPLAFAALASGLYIVSIIALGTDGIGSLSIVPAIALGFSALSLFIAGECGRSRAEGPSAVLIICSVL